MNWLFDRRALKEWQKLGHTIREQFKKETGRTAGKIHAYPQPGYMVMLIAIKIKLRASGYRLVYQVIDEKVVLLDV
uniref:type II toxin-antitoxin system RelE family toxin n=1 Tax=Escherichia coli TaxID=562 RepID=UPI001F2BDF69|nr:type II toxin-antitoxin system RelE/ParE family toxin [Escherichia coli]UGK56314.1 mRNA interferase toxin RelE [Escherichia coli]